MSKVPKKKLYLEPEFDYAALDEMASSYVGERDYPIGKVAVLRIILDMLDDTDGGNVLDDLGSLHEAIHHKVEERYKKARQYIRNVNTVNDLRDQYFEYLIDAEHLDEVGAEKVSQNLSSKHILAAIDALQKDGHQVYVTNVFNYGILKMVFAKINELELL